MQKYGSTIISHGWHNLVDTEKVAYSLQYSLSTGRHIVIVDFVHRS
jgi:hypothetical protein